MKQKNKKIYLLKIVQRGKEGYDMHERIINRMMLYLVTPSKPR